MFALLKVPILIIAFFMAILLCSKKHIVAGGCVIIFCLLYNSYTSSFAFSFVSSKKTSKNVLRVMSYNVDAKCGWYDNLQNWRDIIHLLDNINPDIILPQEFDFYGGDELRMALNVRYPFNCKMNFGEGYYGTEMIFSRYPVLEYEYLLGFPTPVYKLVVDVKGKKINIVNCYLESNKFSEQMESGQHDFLQKLDEGYDKRKTQVNAIVDSLQSSFDGPLIVCGDMNDVSGSYTIRNLQKKLVLKDAWWQGGTGFGFTYHGYGVMRFRLDHILYNNFFELQNVSVPHVGFSDHWPIVADFMIK